MLGYLFVCIDKSYILFLSHILYISTVLIVYYCSKTKIDCVALFEQKLYYVECVPLSVLDSHNEDFLVIYKSQICCY